MPENIIIHPDISTRSIILPLRLPESSPPLSPPPLDSSASLMTAPSPVMSQNPLYFTAGLKSGREPLTEPQREKMLIVKSHIQMFLCLQGVCCKHCSYRDNNQTSNLSICVYNTFQVETLTDKDESH